MVSPRPLEPSAILHVVIAVPENSVSAHPTYGARREDYDKPVKVDARRLAVLLPASLGLPDEIIFVIIKFCFSLGGRVRVNPFSQ